MRVRRSTRHYWARKCCWRRAGQGLPPRDSWLPAMRSQSSGISTTFLHMIGLRSHSSIGLEREHVDRVGPIRSSQDTFDGHDCRTPTPASHTGLLRDTSNMQEQRQFSQSVLVSKHTHGPHDLVRDSAAFVEEIESRPDTGLSHASSLESGGFVGSNQLRRAVSNEMLRSTGTNRSSLGAPSVELSSDEATSACVRIGGHLLAGLTSYVSLSLTVWKWFVDSNGHRHCRRLSSSRD